MTSLLVVPLFTGCEYLARSSASSSGTPGNGVSDHPSVSSDGQFVAFDSAATSLVPGDTNGVQDVFVHDHATGQTQRVSVSSGGVQGNGRSTDPSVSADGRFVAFRSGASNLVPGTSGSYYEVYVRDRHAGVTELISIGKDGLEAGGTSGAPSISADGRYVAFYSSATNLVGSSASNGVYVRDRVKGTTERVNIDEAGVIRSVRGGGSISADGRFVAFTSSSELVAADINTAVDVYVRDRSAGTTELVSRASDAVVGNGDSEGPSLSSDGRFVAFSSYASNLVPGDGNRTWDVFVRDRVTGTTERVSVSSVGGEADLGAGSAALSASGRYVTFSSFATTLVPDDSNGTSDVFIRDRSSGTTSRVSVDRSAMQAVGDSFHPAITADGRYVAFASRASLDGTAYTRHVYLKFALTPRPASAMGSSTIGRGKTGQITIDATWLDPATLGVSVQPSDGVSVDVVDVQGPNTSAVVTITVSPDAASGPRNIIVRNPGNPWDLDSGAVATCFACLEVT